MSVLAYLAQLLGVGASSGDPNFANVSTLLHFDGTNASTTFTDSAGSPKTYSAGGNAQLSTGQKKYGSAALALDGAGDYITTPSNAAFDVGTGDFTVECWAYVAGGLSAQRMLAAKTSGAGESPFFLYHTSGNKWAFTGYSSSAGVVAYSAVGTTTVSTGQWYHVAGVRDGNTFRLYVNGVQEASAAYAGNLRSAAEPFVVGGFDSGAQSLNGYIDDLRFTKGVCRYPGGTTFAPATAAFPNS